MRSSRTWAIAALWVISAFVLVREAAIVVASYELLGEAGTLGVQLGCGLLVALAARGPERTAWAFVAAGIFAWAAGDTYGFTVIGDDPSPPVPSPADVGYLLFPPLVFVGLSLLLRQRVHDASRFLWVDGLVAALSVAAISAAVVVEVALGAVSGSNLATVTTLAYPLSDLVLLGFVAAAAALSGWRLDWTWRLLGAALVSFWLADSGYLLETAAGTYSYPDPIDGGWDLAFALLAAAAWQRRSSSAAEHRPPEARLVALPLVFGASGLVLLVYGGLQHVTPLAIALAALALCGVMVRLALTFRENREILDATRREALTDALTGLGNRRALSIDLADVLRKGPDASPVILALFDLDGFKHYNDTYGHPAGDALLARLATALEQQVEGSGTAYRMGGDEFCVLLLLPDGAAATTMVRDAAGALGERGEGFSITSSSGHVVLPVETRDPSEALRTADQRLYACKQDSRVSAGRQTRDVLLRALVARHPSLAEHSRDVARLAAATAQSLGLDPVTVRRVRHAAELHDIGKVGIPDAILDKPGDLAPEEWAFVRRHTVIGERIIGAAPALREVAAMVRASHERWDGAGYPDQLAGTDIPLGARIVAVADTFDAITTDRSYSPARTDAQALAELRRCAGTQFDPDVVEAFSHALDRRASAV